MHAVLVWLERDQAPAHLYNLLGRNLFDPDHEALRAAITAANKELWPYQNHADTALAKRAMRLLAELGKAAAILDHPERLAKYEREVIATLRAEYAASHGPRANGWDAANLGEWLQTKGIAPERFKDVFREMCAPELEASAGASTIQEPLSRTQGYSVAPPAGGSAGEARERSRVFKTAAQDPLPAPVASPALDRLAARPTTEPQLAEALPVETPAVGAKGGLASTRAASGLRIVILVSLGTALVVGAGALWIQANREAETETKPGPTGPVVGPGPTVSMPKADDDVPTLLERLKDSNWKVQEAAIRLVAQKGPQAKVAGPELARAMGTVTTGNLDELSAALFGVGADPSDVVPILTEVLKERDWDRRAEAARTIGKYGPAGRPAVGALVRSLDHEVASNFRETVGSAISSTGAQPGEVVPLLIPLLDSNHEQARTAAAELLGAYGPQARAAGPALARAAKRAEQWRRRDLLELLKKVNADPAEVVPAIEALLDDQKDSDGIRLAAEVLAEFGTAASTATPALVRALSAAEGSMSRDAIVRAIERIDTGREETLAALTKLLESGTSGQAKEAAIELLGRYGARAKDAGPAMARALASSRDFGLCQAVERAFPRIGADPLSVLPVLAQAIRSNSDRARDTAAKLMGGMRADTDEFRVAVKKAMPMLLETLEDNDMDHRKAAADAIGGLGRAAQAAAPGLIKALGSSNHSLQRAAEEALFRVDPEPTDEMARQLADLLNNQNGSTRDAAMKVLARFGSGAAPAAPEIAKAARQLHGDVQKAAFRTLAAIGPEGMLAVDEAISGEKRWDKERYLRDLVETGPPVSALLLPFLDSREVGNERPVAPRRPVFGNKGKEARRRKAEEKRRDAEEKRRDAKEEREVSGAANAALDKFGEQAIPYLATAMKSGEPEWRLAALRKIARHAPKSDAVLPVAIAAVEDEEKAIRVLAYGVLAKFGPRAKDAAGNLVKAFEQADATEQKKIREAIKVIAPELEATLPEKPAASAVADEPGP